jgi:DNA-directed RNA polymerase specialized sigma24 family protein
MAAATHNRANIERSKHRQEEFAYRREEGYSVEDTARLLGLSLRTGQRYEKILKEKQEGAQHGRQRETRTDRDDPGT